VEEGPDGSAILICPSLERTEGRHAHVMNPLASRFIRPEEVSSHVIRHLVQKVKDTLGHDEEVGQAVITVPAHFNPSQRRATVEAATMAGLKKITLLQGESDQEAWKKAD